jgi:flagellar biosynthesis/type III secretory pathway chaperone
MALHDPEAAKNLLALLDCLEAEYRALLAQDLAQIESTLARKEQLLERLASHPDLASRQKPGGGMALAPAWTRALSRARELNRRNAIVLGPRMLANGARLRCLHSALGGLGLYGADGLAASAGHLAVAPGRSA